MAYLLVCPDCGEEGLDPRYSPSQCQQCGKGFEIEPHCPECDSVLERVKACGAVDFFCNHCNNLVSKRSARYQFKTSQ